MLSNRASLDNAATPQALASCDVGTRLSLGHSPQRTDVTRRNTHHCTVTHNPPCFLPQLFVCDTKKCPVYASLVTSDVGVYPQCQTTCTTCKQIKSGSQPTCSHDDEQFAQQHNRKLRFVDASRSCQKLTLTTLFNVSMLLELHLIV